MGNIVGRGVKVEVGKTEGTAKNVTAITQASPPVGTTDAAHSLLAKSVGYLRSVEGMVQFEGQAVRLAAVPTATTFEIEDTDSTDYPAFSGTAELVPITAWATVTPATAYQVGGGEAERLDTTTLLDIIKQEENGLLAAQTVTIPVNAEDVSSEGMALVKKTAKKGGFLVFRITFTKTGAVRVFRGQPSLPGEDVQKGQLGTGSFTVTVKGFVVEGAP